MSVAEMAREGRVEELAGVGKTIAEKIDALLETGSIPSADKLKQRIPPGLVAVTRIPGLGPKRARMLNEQLGVTSLDDLREAAEQGRLKDVARLRDEGRGQRARRACGRGRRPADGTPAALQGARRRRGAGGRPARPPLGAEGGAGGQRAAARRRGQGPRHRRRHERFEGVRRLLWLPARRRRPALLGGGRGEGADAFGAARRPAHRARGRIRQPAPALHRLGEAQRSPSHGRRQARPACERIRDRRREERRVDRLRDRGGGLREARHAVDPARAAREPRRARGGTRRQPPRAHRARGHPRRPSHAFHSLRRSRLRRGDGPGGARARLRVRRDNRPLGHPRIRK